MNAISVKEVGYLLEAAETRQIVPPLGMTIDLKDIKMSIRFDFLVPQND